MPSSNGSAWFCDRCGHGGFREYDDAIQHETECDPNAVIKSPCPDSPNSSSIDSYYPQAQMLGNIHPPPFSETTLTPFLLIQDVAQAPDNLSHLDIIICQNVEVFQASSSDVSDHETYGGMSVNAGQIGLRCIHCARTPFAKADYSAVFPASFGRVADSLRMMIDMHFKKCTSLPHHTKTQVQQIQSAADARRMEASNNGRAGEEDEWNRIAFSDFCVNLCKSVNIVSRSPAQTGIVLVQQGVDTASGRNRSDSYNGSGSRHQDQQVAKPDSRISTQMMATSSSQSQFTSPSVQIDNEVSTQRLQHSGIGYTRSSASSSYDDPLSSTYPYYQDTAGCWVCKACSHLPLPYRPPGSIWQYNMNPMVLPSDEFMEQHLHQCRFYVGSQSTTNHRNPNIPQGHSPGYMPDAHAGTYGQPPMSWEGPQRPQSMRSQQVIQRVPSSAQRPPRVPVPNQYSSQQNPAVSSPMQGHHYNPYYHDNEEYARQTFDGRKWVTNSKKVHNSATQRNLGSDNRKSRVLIPIDNISSPRS